MIAEMDPVIVPGSYVFATIDPPPANALATVREAEGTSCLLSADDAQRLDVFDGPVLGWITLRVYSALDAVGLTAAVSAALAAQNIACNVVAGRHHDHLLVPIDRVDDAIAALHRLAAQR